MQDTPKVSVIIPVYRSLEHIQKTIDCLRNQTLKELEFIFIDDKGGDGTFDIVREAAKNDSRIVCLENEVNSGPGISRNKGIEAATGEYIAFVDADDLITEDFYEKLYKKAKQKDAWVVKGCRIVVNEDGKEIPSQLNAQMRDRMQTCESMLRVWTFEHTTGIFLRSLVMRTGARNCETARRDQDTCFLMMLMYHVPLKKFAFEESVSYYYMQHGASLIHKPCDTYFLEQMRLSAAFKIDFMMNRLTSMDHARYLATLVGTRLAEVLDKAQGGGLVEEAVILQYIKYFADFLRRWRASGLPFAENVITRRFADLQYSPMAFYSLRHWFASQTKALSQMEKDRHLMLVGPQLKKRIFRLRLRRCFAFGKKRKNLKKKIRNARELSRKYNALLKKAYSQLKW